MACKIIYKGISYAESDFKSQIERYVAINNLFNENETLTNSVYEALGFNDNNLPFVKSDKTRDDDFFIKDEVIVTKELQNIRIYNYDGSINSELESLKEELNNLKIGEKLNISKYTNPKKTTLEDVLSKINLSESNKILLEKIKPLIKDTKIEYVDKFILADSAGMYSDKYDTIRINKSKKNIPLEEVLMHELLHAATFRKISYFESNTKGLSEKETSALNELENIRKILKETSDKYWDNKTRYARDLNPLDGYRVDSIHEIISYAFTNKEFRNAISEIPYKGNKSILDELIQLIANIFGVKQDTVLNMLLANAETLFERTQITTQQKQQALQQYSQYLESLNKPNTNPILQGSQQEQVKKFAELQERLNTKDFIEGAKNAYESGEGLQSNGTQEQYNDYIARVSLGILKNPSSGGYNYTSQVKDIVYHGSKDSKIENVDFTKSKFGKGFYITPDKSYAKGYTKGSGNITSLVINSKNIQTQPDNHFGNKPDSLKELNDYLKELQTSNKLSLQYIGEHIDIKFFKAKEELEQFKKLNSAWDYAEQSIINEKIQEVKQEIESIKKNGEFDTILTNDDGGNKNIYLVFELSQIHILGSKQDIEGFKEFVNEADPSTNFNHSSNSNITRCSL